MIMPWQKEGTFCQLAWNCGREHGVCWFFWR